MTRHILFLILLLPLSGLHAADNNAATNTPSPIPWNQIGAKAGSDYKGDGLTVTPTASGVQLHCVFQRLDGEATPEGLWLTSTVPNTTPDRFRVTAIEVGRTATRKTFDAAVKSEESSPRPHWGRGIKGEGESPATTQCHDSLKTDPESALLLPPTGSISISSQTVRFTRPGLTEEYTVSMDGLRQDFIVEQPLAKETDDYSPSPGGPRFAKRTPLMGELTGGGLGKPLGRGEGEPYLKTHLQPQIHNELLLTLSVTGARVEPAPDGARLVLENSGRKIAYTRLRVTDATGKELPARIEVSPVGDEVTSLKSSDLIFGNFEEMNFLMPTSPDSKLAIVINDADAVYPVRIDPTFSDANWSALGSGLYLSESQAVVYALAVSGSTLYAGGNFATAGGSNANYIAQWNGTNWSALGSGLSYPVNALAVSGSTLYAGGDFTTAGGSNANYIARWNGTNWSALGSGVSGVGDALVFALAVSGSTLYVGGGFTNAGGSAANCIAQWNGTNWSALGSGVGAGFAGGYFAVSALAVSGSKLYAGGSFSTAGGSNASCVAQWNGTNWLPLGSGISGAGNFDGGGPEVNALAVSGGTLYAGGDFTTAGGSNANYIARWNGTNWSALGSGVSGVGDALVFALAVSGSALYAAGTPGPGTNANCIAQWNGSTWSPLGSGVSGEGFATEVNALAVSGSKLYVGGWFTTAGTNAAADAAVANLPVDLAIITTNAAFGFTNSVFGFDVSGPSGSNVVIQASTNLSNWIALQTNLLGSNSLLYFSDSQSSTNHRRFYRAVMP